MTGEEAHFDELAAQMRRISLGEESYGDGLRPHEQANEFYLDRLLGESVARASRSLAQPPGDVDLLISLCGFSPTTTILAFELLKPRRLVVITSEDAEESINVLGERIVGSGKLQHKDFLPRRCVPTDPLGIYRIVAAELEEHARRVGRPSLAYIDITGGRKVMSAAAALAAWQLDLRICYVESDWDPMLRRAVPGSDRLLLLDNPTSLFGEQEMRAAQHSFDGGAFEAAHARFEDLAVRLAEPGRARFMAALSELYRAWCALELSALPTSIDRVHATLSPIRGSLSVETTSSLERQLSFLSRLARRDRSALLLGFHILDDHYRGIGRHDFAALLSYRTIEGCLVERLKVRFPGFDDSDPEYDLISTDQQQFKRSWTDVMNLVDGQQKRRSLPPFIGLFSAAVVLRVLDDDLLRLAGLWEVDELRSLRDLARVRNDSVLAHGDRSVSKTDSEQLNSMAQSVVRAYWTLHHADENLDELRARLRFIRAGR
ncbi:TIGR02710 family CRISPR-associated CARF protein [Saccharothrix sp. NRRL B-16314]|uniref:TIGR02710 family CRISPR-associated CARF protein n=1 Tax=Saccharothrix sp. NRRL B-16314 TaxID=1463825 RepID=UPI0005259BB7|nr:TIGR02710 family CRISPR-associated CARF protein [Saccharothrix sp. NRRL B-16314]